MTPPWKPCIDSSDELYYKVQETISKIDSFYLNKYSRGVKYYPNTYGPLLGNSSELLYLFYSSRYNKNKDFLPLANKELKKLIQSVSPETSHNYSYGLAGLLWLLHHLDKNGFIEGVEKELENTLMSFVFKNCLKQMKSGAYDFMMGGLGICLPIIESKKITKTNLEYVSDIINELERISIKVEKKDQIFWPIRLENKTHISFGLAHGLPGIIIILSKLSKKNICREQCDRLVNQCLNFILSHKTEKSNESLFPAFFSLEEKHPIKPSKNRLTWCYGDLNIAFSLIAADRQFSRTNFREQAFEIINFGVKNHQSNYLEVLNGDFCHGTIGTAHIYNRLYNYFGDINMKKFSALYFENSLKKLKFTNNIPKVYNHDYNRWKNTSGTIEGIPGIGLSLISSIHPSTPSWDSMCLLDI